MTYCNLFTQMNTNYVDYTTTGGVNFGVYDNSVFGSGFGMYGSWGMPFMSGGWMNLFPSFTPSFTPDFSNMFNFDLSKSFANFGSFGSFDFSKAFSGLNFTFNPTAPVSASDITVSASGKGVVDYAQQFVGKINNDAQGVAKFSPKGSSTDRGWCCDFVTYCASKALGDKYPKNMITGSPAGLRDAAKGHSCWVDGWSTSAKPGDIVLLPGKGQSGLHNAIIKSINSDGTITCISGNSSNAVKEVKYSTSKVKGFVSIGKLA